MQNITKSKILAINKTILLTKVTIDEKKLNINIKKI